LLENFIDKSWRTKHENFAKGGGKKKWAAVESKAFSILSVCGCICVWVALE